MTFSQSYLEEMMKTKDKQVDMLSHEKQALHNKMDAVAEEARQEREKLQGIVLELHEKMWVAKARTNS